MTDGLVAFSISFETLSPTLSIQASKVLISPPVLRVELAIGEAELPAVVGRQRTVVDTIFGRCVAHEAGLAVLSVVVRLPEDRDDLVLGHAEVDLVDVR